VQAIGSTTTMFALLRSVLFARLSHESLSGRELVQKRIAGFVASRW
jgi:hypothetical protein